MNEASKHWDTDAEREFWSERCYESFWWFCRQAYGIDSNPLGGWLIDRLHKPFCDWFQGHMLEWLAWRKAGLVKRKNLLICVFREFGKTTLITNAGMAWLALRDPELAIFIGSENLEKANKWMAPIPKVLSGEDTFQQFTTYYGRWGSDSRMNAKRGFTHAARMNVSTRDASFSTWGVRTGLQGARADLTVFDDPLSYEAIIEDAGFPMLLNEHYSGLLPVTKRNGARIIIGTPYVEDDLIGEQIRKHGIKSIVGMPWPGHDVRADGVWDVFYMPARDAIGIPVAPEIWPADRMLEYENDNPLHYYAQILCSPQQGGQIHLDRATVDRAWINPDQVPPNIRVSMHLDTAFKSALQTKSARDHNVISWVGHSQDGSGICYLLGAVGSDKWTGRMFNDQLVITLQQLRRQNQYPIWLTDEIELGGKAGTWEMTLETWCHQAGLPKPNNVLLLNRGGKQKIRRLVNAASFWRDGKMKLVRGAPGVERVVEQMLRIGLSKFDDYADAVADCYCEQIYKPMRRDADREEAEGNLGLAYDEYLKPWSYNDSRKSIMRKNKHSIHEVIY